jgi:hypothetical protein
MRFCELWQESAIKFLSYESAKRVFAQHWDCVPDQTLISNTSRFISGGIGGVISQLSKFERFVFESVELIFSFEQVSTRSNPSR